MARNGTGPRAVTRSVVLLLAAVAVYRLTLVDRGALAFVDESLYFRSVMVLQALGAGDVHGALGHLADNLARPGAILMNMPVAALQAIPLAFGVAPSNPRSLLIPVVVNVAVSLATLYLFFDICVVLCRDRAAALVAAVVYALLVNTNLYIRHVLPYDGALCVSLYALWLGMTRPPTRLALVTGILVGATITIYPGYYLLACVLGVAIVGRTRSEGLRATAQFAAVFAVGAAAVVAAIELLCRAGGISYIRKAQEVSRMIGMGSFDEGWTFLPEYLLKVERLSGVALLAGTAVCLWRAASALRRGALRPIDWLLVPAVAAWAWQAASAAQFHRIVFYGRLIHPWILFMAWALADAMTAIDGPALRKAASVVVLTAALVSWAPSARAYYRLAYPSDVLYSLRIDTTRVPLDQMRCELALGQYLSRYASPGPLDRATRYPYTSDSHYFLVNFCQALGLVIAPPPPSTGGIANATLLYDGPHWMTFPAYGFEGLPPDARDALVQNRYRVRAYRLPTPPSD